MAALNQFHQRFVDLPDGRTIGISVVEIESTSDTITLPDLDNTTSGVAVKQLLSNGQTASTITSSGDNSVTIATTTVPTVASGLRKVVLVSLHKHKSNYNEEA